MGMASVGMDLKKIDVFAYAMVLYYVWTGVKPWGEEISPDEIESLVLSNKRPEFSVKLKESIRSLIESSWHANPDHRLSFSEITKSLQN